MRKILYKMVIFIGLMILLFNNSICQDKNKALIDIFDQLEKCLPDTVINRFELIDENEYISSCISILSIKDNFKYFDCKNAIFKQLYSDSGLCSEIFPEMLCERSPGWTDPLILRAFYRNFHNQPYDMQHDIDSMMNDLRMFDSISAYRSVADTLNGTYIPKSIEEALDILEKELTAKERDAIGKLTEDEFALKEHISLGMLIRNSWSLWGCSRFQRYLDALSDGIDHPDDQSTLILILLHRKINGKPLDKWKLFEEQKKNIKLNKEKWEKVKNR